MSVRRRAKRGTPEKFKRPPRKEQYKKQKVKRQERIHYAPCVECGGHGQPVTGEAIYPNRPDLHKRLFYLCGCGAYVGSHRKSYTPLGYPAGPRTRVARQRAHSAFDRIWRHGLMSRDDAYEWLSKAMGIPAMLCHIGKLNEAQAIRVTRISTELWDATATQEQRSASNRWSANFNKERRTALQKYAQAQDADETGRPDEGVYEEEEAEFNGEAAYGEGGADGMPRVRPCGDGASRDGIC